MMGYLNYSVEDLLANESFQQYCSGSSEEAVLHWTKFLQEHPEMKSTLDEAAQWFAMLNGDQGNLQEQSARLLYRVKADNEIPTIGNRKKTIQYRTWWAAAAVLLILATTGFFLLRQLSKTELADRTTPQKTQTDIAPGGNKAVLTLSDGQTIVLDNAANGALSQQGGTKLVKIDGRLTYNAEEKTAQVLYNTITTPKGGQYQLLLADGTKVWLNAASSLRYPTAFSGSERNVELTGEGYFEVAHNAAMPFHVKVNDMDVQVLGTHFNINSYSDEETIKTTLLEGKVKVRKASAIAILLPGQQAQVNNHGEIKLEKNADVEAAIAWKNGLFQLKGADVKTIGRQIERWYDVEVSYSGNLQSAHLSGEVPRTLNLSQVINVLETSGIDVKASGRNLLITPKP